MNWDPRGNERSMPSDALRQEQQSNSQEELYRSSLAGGGFTARQHLRMDMLFLPHPAQEIETSEGKQHSSRAPEQGNQTQDAPQNGVGARFVAD